MTNNAKKIIGALMSNNIPFKIKIADVNEDGLVDIIMAEDEKWWFEIYYEQSTFSTMCVSGFCFKTIYGGLVLANENYHYENIKEIFDYYNIPIVK